ncbi:DNA-directed RNA polymerase III subunit [Wickerhamomyces ciferrii]|uniref:DNA-directed RNA polymerase III subunit n=1 Tax=Wickerhamomyces ciferrii (strain ATCC 14091 / BCRC 22168 / CBS 111 / JCM 3599 / NBRC 0793 / NRRL Y-1031 F-60-10) TaxID=1206466 RepID=K0KTG5_WICCF|nr:DNA-directed RNA polymerase III subunit [Wickerhamomyces ciferrii]CCH44578.1 DNA-directed RNA polymerase III subunit [Wickerhamomyces ciferrii]
MSDKIPTSSRLDSLSRRSTPASKPGLKFKPKVVARRSKEERDAEAPVNAPESSRPSNRGNANRGRGASRGGRGGRGGRALAGTHLVTAGPLASGNVLNQTGSFSRAGTASPTPDYLSNLVKREGSASRATSVGLESDDEDDPSKIDMSKEYKFDPEHTELFPVRPVRNAHVDDSKDSYGEREERSVSPEFVETGSNITEPSLVKEEPQEKDLTSVLKEKDTDLQKKLNELQLQNEFLSVDPTEAKEETERLNKDHRSIVKSIIDADNKPEKFLFVQLPRVLPNFEQDEIAKLTRNARIAATKPAPIKEEGDGEGDLNVKDAPTTAKPTTAAPQKPDGELDELEGLIGKLRVHKSGKVTMKLGNVVMDVGKGSQTNFLQEVVLDEGEAEKSAYLLGHLEEKVVVTPRFG